MRLTANGTPDPAAAEGADHRIVLLGILLATIVLGYFYAVGNLYFSTGRMSRIFEYLLIFQDAKTAWLSLGVCLLAAFWRNSVVVLRIVDFISSHAIAVAAAVVALLGIGTIVVYHNNAFSMDEYAAVFQAKVFAAGRLTAEVPVSVVDWLVPPGFNGMFLLVSRTTGQAMEGYWPGFSLILAPFEVFGIAWLCNPFLAGLALLLIYRITLEITRDRRAAGWAVLFTVASGTFTAYAISYYSMQAHLTANLLYLWLLLKPTPRRAFCAGVVGSIALVLHNPFPHAMFAAPWIVAMARSKQQRRSFWLLVLGYLPLVIIVGAGWLALRERVTAGNSGFNVISNNVGGVFSLPDKSMVDAEVASMVKMWIWSVPSLFLFAALGRLRHGDDRRVRLMSQSAILTLAGYVFFVFDQGHGWGYRYFQSAWGVVPILAACAMTARTGVSNTRLAAFAGAASVLNLLLVLPFQMLQIDTIIATHTAQLPRPRRPGNDVYFVRADRGFYPPDLVQMDPFLRAQDLILNSRGSALDAELRRQNWPRAVLVERTFGVEEWHLGPTDQRQDSRSWPGGKRFMLAYTEHAGR